MAQRFGAVIVPPQNRPPRGATLLRSVNEVVESDERWVRGLVWRPQLCDGQVVSATGLCGGGSFSGFTLPDDFGEFADYLPPFVAAGAKCSAVGGEAAIDDAVAAARALLDSCQTVGIARELWRGDVAKQGGDADLPNEYLAHDGVVDVVVAGAVPARDALAALEQGLAECSCGGQGVIHAMPYTATIWSSLDLVERQPDGRLLTALGTLVVADPGYDGSSPTGAAPGAAWADAWAYATGMVDVRLGRVETAGDRTTIDRSNNDFAAWAYRPFSATFDPCCHLGVQVDHTDRS